MFPRLNKTSNLSPKFSNDIYKYISANNSSAYKNGLMGYAVICFVCFEHFLQFKLSFYSPFEIQKT